MATIRKANKPGRNAACPCGSGMKFKRCHGAVADRPVPVATGVSYIDTGETAVRWVICDAKGTSFFSDKDNRILVFTDKAAAFAIAGLSEFSSQEPGEINVAGVGETKFAHLRENFPHVEVADVETAAALIQARIDIKQQELVQELFPGTDATANENQEQEPASQNTEGGGA